MCPKKRFIAIEYKGDQQKHAQQARVVSCQPEVPGFLAERKIPPEEANINPDQKHILKCSQVLSFTGVSQAIPCQPPHQSKTKCSVLPARMMNNALAISHLTIRTLFIIYLYSLMHGGNFCIMILTILPFNLKRTNWKLIDGVKTKALRLIADERGWLMEILRSDDPVLLPVWAGVCDGGIPRRGEGLALPPAGRPTILRW